MKFCRYCGKPENDDSAIFCENCGKKFSSSYFINSLFPNIGKPTPLSLDDVYEKNISSEKDNVESDYLTTHKKN